MAMKQHCHPKPWWIQKFIISNATLETQNPAIVHFPRCAGVGTLMTLQHQTRNQDRISHCEERRIDE
jgi:hypothetical protein